MPRLPKGPPPDELVQVRNALATNLRAHMAANHRVRGLAPTAAAEEIGRATGVGKNTVLRAIRANGADADLRLDTLVKLAIFFGVTAGDLLIDHSAPAQRKPAKSNYKSNETARDQRKDADVDRASLQRARRA